jgi:hypothetical protein
VILDADVLADLAVAITPKAYVRVTPMAHAAGFGATRFASPTRAFQVIYIAQDLTTAIAETLVRDRFQGRARRKLLDVETLLAGFVDALRELNVTLLATPQAVLPKLRGSCEARRPHVQATSRRVTGTGFSNMKSAKSSMMGQSGR